METLLHIVQFFAQTLIIVTAIVVILITIGGLIAKAKLQKSFKIEILNEKLEEQTEAIKEVFLSEGQLKVHHKKQKAADKEKAKKIDDGTYYKGKVFVLDFLKGDIKASASEHLRNEISAVLGVATPDDEIIVRVESPGGLVHGYGFAAAQLVRIRDAKIPLTVCVDHVAASGGYLMACTANKIIASPFALIGSIGVVAQVPNFNRLLKKYDVDYKEYTAGDYKRTVSLFGEITAKGEEKFKEQLQLTHDMFKHFVGHFRPQLDMEKIATGEYWYGEMAQKLGLVDQIMTSDEYLVTKAATHQVIQLSFETKPTLSEKLSQALSMTLTQVLSRFISENHSNKSI